MVNHGTVVLTVHEHPLVAATLNVASPPTFEKLAELDDTPNVHAASTAWSILIRGFVRPLPGS
jgi:hypothetical protein